MIAYHEYKRKKGKTAGKGNRQGKTSTENGESRPLKSWRKSVWDKLFGCLCPPVNKRAQISKKSGLVFHFNAFGQPFVEVSYYEKGALIKSKTFDISSVRPDGAPEDTDSLAEAIRAEFDCKNRKSVLLVSSDRCFTHVLSYPKINPVKVFSLYRRDIKFSFPERRSRSKCIVSGYSHPLGYILLTRFIPLSVIESFQKLSQSLGSRLVRVDTYADYLYRCLKCAVREDFAYVYAEGGRGLVLNVCGGSLTAFGEFTYEDVKDVVINYLLTVSKHEFEYEKAEISNVLLSGSLSGELKEYFGEVRFFNPDLSVYRKGGVRV